ncbi:hypothetical protein [Streptomyces sp. NPDC047009]|uniref:hypothetical protein n=1 Tax=Streptomyces sp. NPDC047009 TaxID=3154496 RepID=UPI0033D40C61
MSELSISNYMDQMDREQREREAAAVPIETREDLASMTPEEIVKAKAEGRLDALLKNYRDYKND